MVASVFESPESLLLSSSSAGSRPFWRMVTARSFELNPSLFMIFSALADGADRPAKAILRAPAARVAGMPRLVIMARAEPTSVSERPNCLALTRKPVPRALFRSSMRRLPAPMMALSVPTVSLKVCAPLMPLL